MKKLVDLISSIPSVSEAVIFMIDDAPFMSESGAGFKSHLFQTATRFIPKSKFSSGFFVLQTQLFQLMNPACIKQYVQTKLFQSLF